ncbi:hypothetical protein [Grapevine badnavirus 1]|uniref:Uncharacterized protein n=1 Tax=Grapevine badnavirus 1 TaxID=2052838 RepID=A0A2H4N979_9VIRU|nr:hypothetical protein KM646_gp3 [Grapevine badnavirus 1]ATV81255.1 hypothetical protein [Grapevine badnavirus 1]
MEHAGEGATATIPGNSHGRSKTETQQGHLITTQPNNWENGELFRSYSNTVQRGHEPGGISLSEFIKLRAQLKEIESLAITRALVCLKELRDIHTIKLDECRKSSSPGRDGNYWSDHCPSCQHHDRNLEEILSQLERVAADVQKFSL